MQGYATSLEEKEAALHFSKSLAERYSQRRKQVHQTSYIITLLNCP
jgi:hypothetical protein